MILKVYWIDQLMDYNKVLLMGYMHSFIISYWSTNWFKEFKTPKIMKTISSFYPFELLNRTYNPLKYLHITISINWLINYLMNPWICTWLERLQSLLSTN